MTNLQSYIDHTLLKATATSEEIHTLCTEAIEYQFFAVCVNSIYVPYAVQLLQETNVKVASTVGFPLGAETTLSKVTEAKEAIQNGANEIDMVINIGWLKDGEKDKCKQEIAAIKNTIGDNILKVIIETCFLNDEEKVAGCQWSVEEGADFVKTSTGFGTAGATLNDVQLMIETVQGKAQVKASGGIKDKVTAKAYIQLGVHRIGTSNGIRIVQESM